MAWVPLCSQPGDVLCVMLGGPIPFVLREVQGQHCILVGLAYLDGMMHGEFMETDDATVREFVIR